MAKMRLGKLTAADVDALTIDNSQPPPAQPQPDNQCYGQ
eukprot:SAG22_NODE_5994_length_919_cov_1.067073_2_plen_39_part_00